MNGINIILILGIIYIIYLLTKPFDFSFDINVNQHTDRFPHIKSEKFISGSPKNILADDIANDVVSWNNTFNSYDSTLEKTALNPNFLYIKWHNDYRDVMTALNNLTPDKKQLFNLPNQPLYFSEPPVNEVKNMVSDFVSVLNDNIKSDVPSFRNPNSGWDEAITDPTVQSGWNKVQLSLGLAPSLYEDPAVKQPVNLLAVTRVLKYETDDEIKYLIDMIIQKRNVDDQMVLRASFIQDKRPLRDENNFFVTSTIKLKLVIESLSILGYLSKDGNDSRLLSDKDKELYYEVNQMESNNLVDPKDVLKVLNQKYKQRHAEMEQRNALLDEEGQNFHRTLPKIYEFDNIKDTRTIYDDLSNKRKVFI